ncbi:MAG TPA: hypothetical protein H9674_05460 [Firmicutes bacterium]|nr:hypothetical protein [Bacillota bacterium]
MQGLSQIFKQDFSKKFVGFSINPLLAYKKHPIPEISRKLDFVRPVLSCFCVVLPAFFYFFYSRAFSPGFPRLFTKYMPIGAGPLASCANRFPAPPRRAGSFLRKETSPIGTALATTPQRMA